MTPCLFWIAVIIDSSTFTRSGQPDMFILQPIDIDTWILNLKKCKHLSQYFPTLYS